MSMIAIRPDTIIRFTPDGCKHPVTVLVEYVNLPDTDDKVGHIHGRPCNTTGTPTGGVRRWPARRTTDIEVRTNNPDNTTGAI